MNEWVELWSCNGGKYENKLVLLPSSKCPHDQRQCKMLIILQDAHFSIVRHPYPGPRVWHVSVVVANMPSSPEARHLMHKALELKEPFRKATPTLTAYLLLAHGAPSMQ
jgi:hypothetical protein